MKIKGGYFKNHVHIDLSNNKIEKRSLSDEFILKYIGGRGFCAKLVWDNFLRVEEVGIVAYWKTN